MKYRERFAVILIMFIFLSMIDRYLLTWQIGSSVSSAMDSLVTQLDYHLGSCPPDMLRIEVEGSYLCRSETEPSIWQEIYDTYPISAEGKELAYGFLDRGKIEIANQYLNNWHEVDRHDPIYIEPPITWEEDPYSERYWRFIFYSLRSTRHLLAAWMETGNTAYSDKLKEIVESFVDDGMDKTHSWDDLHGVSYRTLVLINTWWKLREENELPIDLSTKVLKALQVHANFLLDENHFEHEHNHGITQALALYVLSANFPDLPGADQWASVGKERLDQMITTLVGEDGALTENSPYYHFYSLDKFWEILSYSKKYNIDISDHFEDTIQNMITYGTYILQPNRYIPIIGASLRNRVQNAGNFRQIAQYAPEFLYVLSQGEGGEIPSLKNSHFDVSGQIILRSSWEDNVEFQEQTHVVFDAGPYSTKHSQLDALNLNVYSNGSNLITDTGLYTYEKGPYFNYFNSTAAHNTVIVDDRDQLNGSTFGGHLIEHDGVAYAVGSHNLYGNVNHYRAVTLLNHDLILVIDHLDSSQEHSYKQMFHLFPEAELIVDGLTVTGQGKIPKQTITIHQLLNDGVQLHYVKGQDSPPAGLCSFEYEVAVPCYEVSYETNGTTSSYVTLLEIGERDPLLHAELSDDQNTVKVTTDDGQYTIDIDLPETFIEDQRPARYTSEEYSGNLFFDEGEWQLDLGESISGQSFQIEEADGNLELVSSTSDYNSKFELQIDSLNTYYSIAGRAITDIPIDNETISTIRVYEQEDFVPIFGYHSIIPDDEPIKTPNLEMHLSKFIEQIKYATEVMGCHWITFDNLMENFVLKDKKVPRKACVINFDDGYLNNYIYAYPILEQYGVKATFYIVTNRINLTDRYMTWNQINELYLNGHEIGSHTIDSGGLVSADWNYDELVYQIEGSKTFLQQLDYNTQTFAYPLGQWNDEIVNIIKQSGYIAGRDITTPNRWTDQRTITSSMDDEFIWHMYYYKPEQVTIEQLNQDLAYNTWWQFENGFRVSNHENMTLRSSIHPTSTSYGIVILENAGTQISNKFIVSQDADYTINLFASIGSKTNEPNNKVKVYVDGNAQMLFSDDSDSCLTLSARDYCDYYIDIELDEGEHILTIEVIEDEIILDKFRVFRDLNVQQSYPIKIIDRTEIKWDPSSNVPESISLTVTVENSTEVEAIELPRIVILLCIFLGLGLLRWYKIWKIKRST